MRICTAITTATLALLTVAGCSSGTTPTTTVSSSPATATSTAASPQSSTSSTAASPSNAQSLPNLVGMGLQSAQDTAQAAGFRNLKSHDALGHDRHQVLDRDWKVCTQTPAPGSGDTAATVDLGAVKVEETCPATDQGTQTQTAGTVMPDFKGKAASTARDALNSSTSLTLKDVSGQNRSVIVASNWQVCTQDPAPGTQITGQPVTLGVVKFGETCP